MTNLLDHYNAFVNFRSKFIARACDKATYTDSRDTEKGKTPVRPVVIITSEDELLKLNRDIARWKKYSELLSSKDPARFDMNSTLFSITPTLIMEPKKLALRTGAAQSSRIMTKATFLFRLRSLLKHEFLHSGGEPNKRTLSIQKEITKVEADSEQKYRVKGHAHSELYLYYMPKNETKNKRIRVSHAGVFIYDPSGEIEISFPEETPHRNKSLSGGLAALGIKPLKTNLQLSALIYRETDRSKAMKLKKEISQRARKLKPKKEI